MYHVMSHGEVPFQLPTHFFLQIQSVRGSCFFNCVINCLFYITSDRAHQEGLDFGGQPHFLGSTAFSP